MMNRRHLVPAHMNRHELNILDHLQGKTEFDPKTHVRSYVHLEALLKNPHILSSVHHHAKKYAADHLANGGPTRQEMEEMAKHGTHGDNEMALLGPHTLTLFKHLSGGHISRNHDGYPQFFSIGGALGGIWDTLKGAVTNTGKNASKAWVGLKPITSDVARGAAAAAPQVGAALGSEFGPVGIVAGGVLGRLGGTALNKFADWNGPGHLSPEMSSGIGNAASMLI